MFVLLYLLFFNLGPQPIVFMFFGELFPSSYKVLLNGIGFTCLFGASVAAVYAFPFFKSEMQGWIYVIYGILTFLLGVSGTLIAPETFGKSLGEIEGMIKKWR